MEDQMHVARFVTGAELTSAIRSSELDCVAYRQGLRVKPSDVEFEDTSELPHNIIEEMRAYIKAHK